MDANLPANFQLLFVGLYWSFWKVSNRPLDRISNYHFGHNVDNFLVIFFHIQFSFEILYIYIYIYIYIYMEFFCIFYILKFVGWFLTYTWTHNKHTTIFDCLAFLIWSKSLMQIILKKQCLISIFLNKYQWILIMNSCNNLFLNFFFEVSFLALILVQVINTYYILIVHAYLFERLSFKQIRTEVIFISVLQRLLAAPVAACRILFLWLLAAEQCWSFHIRENCGRKTSTAPVRIGPMWVICHRCH